MRRPGQPARRHKRIDSTCVPSLRYDARTAGFRCLSSGISTWASQLANARRSTRRLRSGSRMRNRRREITSWARFGGRLLAANADDSGRHRPLR